MRSLNNQTQHLARVRQREPSGDTTNAIEIKQPATVTHVGTLSMPTHTCAPSIGEFRRSCAGVVQMLKISRFSRNTPYLVSFSQHCQRFHNYKLCGPAKKCSQIVQMPDKSVRYAFSQLDTSFDYSQAKGRGGARWRPGTMERRR